MDYNCTVHTSHTAFIPDVLYQLVAVLATLNIFEYKNRH